MASAHSPVWRRWLQRKFAWLFSVCPGGNFHWRRDVICYCVAGENGAACAAKLHGVWTVLYRAYTVQQGNQYAAKGLRVSDFIGGVGGKS
jgi:hypothetical protein